MKKFFIILALLFPLVAICQNWQWAIRYGGTGYDGGGPRLTDSNNNMYIMGSFQNQFYSQTDTFVSNGFNDILLAKCDSNGKEIWIKHFGGNNPNGTYESGQWCALDKTGNYFYLSGTFYMSLTIDSLHVNYSPGMDVFLAKFDLSGNCIWLKNASGLGQNKSGAFQVDTNNNIILTGTNSDSASFGNFKVPAGSFLVKYDSNGNCLWAKQKFSGILFSCMKFIGNDLVACGTANNVIVTIDTINFFNPKAAIIARFDTTGNVKWAKSQGDYGIFIDVDRKKNIHYSGEFLDSATFDGISLITANKDFFYIKYDEFGSLQWIRQSNASISASCGMIKSDTNGNTYLVGSFKGAAIFGSFPVTSSAQGDFFVVKYDSSGNSIGINHFGNNGGEGGGVITDNNGFVIVSGQFINTINIGTNVLTSINSSTPDFFVAKCDAITGVSEINKFVNNQLLIYANPTTGKCNITIPDDFLNEKNLTLTIIDNNNGKLIQQQKLEMSEGKIKLNLEQEAKGVYNIILSNGKKNYTGKIVFE